MTHRSHGFIANTSTTAHATATAAELGPVVLTETELDRVAAAGSKPGAASGSGLAKPSG